MHWEVGICQYSQNADRHAVAAASLSASFLPALAVQAPRAVELVAYLSKSFYAKGPKSANARQSSVITLWWREGTAPRLRNRF
jgi:hypothetical protein